MDFRKQLPIQSFQNDLLGLEEILERYGITTFELLSLCRLPEDEGTSKLSQRINLSMDKTRIVIHEFRQQFSNSTGLAVSQLGRNHKIPSGIDTLDRLLSGGISLGSLTEVFGSSGSGKSQFLFQIALQAQLHTRRHDIPGKCIYISTESALETRRLTQMANSNHLLPQNALENISCTYCQDEESQDHIIFTQLPSKLKASQENDENVTLVIIDSIGHHFRLQESFINNLTYLRTYLERQELELGRLRDYAYLKSNLEAVTNRFLRSNSSFRYRSLKNLYLLDLYRHLSQLAKVFNIAILIANQVSDLVENQTSDLEEAEDCDPLKFTLQLGSFSGWKENKEDAPLRSKLLNNIENARNLQSFRTKRRKLNCDMTDAFKMLSSQPPKKISALGYTWARLVSHKILLWKSYQLKANWSLTSNPDLVSVLIPFEGKENDHPSDEERDCFTTHFAKVISPVVVANIQSTVQFRIVHAGLTEV